MSDNSENSLDNVNNKKKTYFANSQMKYAEKCKVFTIKYVPNEMDIVKNIECAVSENGKSANAWIKEAIKEKLKRDGYIKE